MARTKYIRLRFGNTCLILVFVLAVCILRVFSLGPLHYSQSSSVTAYHAIVIPAFPERAAVEIKVTSTQGRWTGSGVIIGREGQTYYALTCYHVTRDADLFILIAKKRSATIIASAPEYDLSLVKFISPDDLTVVPYTVGRLKEWVMVV